jgi:hypothetical protein
MLMGRTRKSPGMRIRTFDGGWKHYHSEYTPYSYSCPYLGENGKHCQGPHGYQGHYKALGDGINHFWKLNGPTWRLCRPCFVNMKIGVPK